MKNRGVFWLLAVLLLLDIIFIAVHLAFELADYGLFENNEPFLNPLYTLETEGSYGNLYQHAKQGFIVVALTVALARSGKIMYLAWAALFGYFLADDVLLLHERGGEFLAELLNLPFIAGMMPWEYAQFIHLSLVAAVLFPVFVYAFCISGNHERRVTVHLVLGVLLLVVFAGIVDQLDRTPLTWSVTGLTSLLQAIEEGGELVAFSLLLAYTYYVAVHLTAPRPLIQVVPRSVWRKVLTTEDQPSQAA